MAALGMVIDIAAESSGISADRLNALTVVDQDMRIAGEDVVDFAEALTAEFGESVRFWPWKKFAMLDEGLPLSFPFLLLKQLITWPIRGQFEYPNAFERLELGHIAAVFENGEWFEP